MRPIITRHAVTKVAFILSAGCSLLLVASATADSQTIWHDHTRPQSLRLEFNYAEHPAHRPSRHVLSTLLGLAGIANWKRTEQGKD